MNLMYLRRFLTSFLTSVMLLLVVGDAGAKTATERLREEHAAQQPLSRTGQEQAALERCQAVIGQKVGDLSFRDAGGRTVRLSQFLGKPLVINLIYTSCAESCGVVTAMLADTYETAFDALGDGSFTALTIGFDWKNDTPGRMRAYARQQGVEGFAGWHFLSGGEGTVGKLVDAVGFTYFPSPKGFDHLDQMTIINGEGVIESQIYGDLFDKPLLIEPLKAMVFGATAPFRSLDDLVKKVRLFCTIYDPSADRYQFDYSLFLQIAVGAVIITIGFTILARELLAARRRRRENEKSTA